MQESTSKFLSPDTVDGGSGSLDSAGGGSSLSEPRPFTGLTPGRDPTLLTAAEMAEADAAADQRGIAVIDLMEAAGRAAADCLVGYLGTPQETNGEIAILCGTGNNGGDGIVMARYLAEWGYSVRLMLAAERSALKGVLSQVARRWPGSFDPLDTLAVRTAAVIVDGLIGAGLSRDVDGKIAEVVEAANASNAFRFALDVPTGLCSDTGHPRGAVFKADATITFFRRKPGHVLAPGRYLCGGGENIHVADIGISADILEQVAPQCFENTPAYWGARYPHIGPATHKYDRGHVLVLGGKEPALGASRLAAQAALRIGAGLCTLAAPSENYSIQASALTDIMVRRFENNFGFIGMLSDQRISAVVLGPGAGIGEKMAELVTEVVSKKRATVVDADALTSLAGRIDHLKKRKKGNVVLTPHDGEFARLFPEIDLYPDRVEAARRAAKKSDSIIVLKGVTTIVAEPGGRATIASNAPAWLSVGGTGDVLSGAIAGLLGQGMPAFEAASAGVWLHGAAAMKCGRGMIASDLLFAFKRVLP